MDLAHVIEMFVHLDKTLGDIINQYGGLTYLILFCIIFCETGFVVTPFLPGDSLLFVAGTFAAISKLDVSALLVLLTAAAVIGDNTNYWIGYNVGPKVFHKENVRFLNKKHLDRTHRFFEKYGVKAIIIARFVPIVRTFTPFVAGIGRMSYLRFLRWDIAGGLLWVFVGVWSGYFFGNIRFVREHFSLVILAIVIISIMPAVIEYLRHRRQERAARRMEQKES
jgi:membrane-associated protein